MPSHHRASSPLVPVLAAASAALASLLGGCSADDPIAPVAVPMGNPGDVLLRVALLGDDRGALRVALPGQPEQICPRGCAYYVAPGTEVILTAMPGLNGVVRGWSLPECGSDVSCTVRVDAELTVQLTAELAFNVAFLTSLAFPASLLPRAGDAANQACGRAAAEAGLHGSRYVAWLSAEGPTPDASDDVQPVNFFQHQGGWVRPDGQPVALSLASLLRGELLHPISLDQQGSVATTRGSWTGTSAAGLLARTTAGSSLTCGDWVEVDDAFSAGIASSETTWIGEGYAATCDALLSLLCFGDDSDAELPPPQSEGRLAFTSGGTFAPGGGLSSADELCQREACEAGLTGSTDCAADPGTSRSFKAYLHTSTQPAWERFDLAGPAWVRTDGVLWLAAAELGEDGDRRRTSLSVSADGSYLTPLLNWTGDVAGVATCQDWTSTSAADRGALGRQAIVDGSRLADARFQSCAPPDNGFALICLEE